MRNVSTYLTRTCWTEEEDRFIELHYVQLSQREMAIRLSRTKGNIQSRLKQLALQLTPEQKSLKKQAAINKLIEFNELNPQDSYTAEELNYLTHNYPNTHNRKIALALNRSEACIASKANKLGLKKTPEYIKNMYQVIIPSFHTREGRNDRMQDYKKIIIQKRQKNETPKMV